MQLRYYRDVIDTGHKLRFLYDTDAVYFYNFDNEIKAVTDKDKRIDLAERGDIMTSRWAPLT
jgi:hypothetical protein